MKTIASWAAAFGLTLTMCCGLAFCGSGCNEAHGTESDESSSEGIEPAESSSDESTGTESTSTGTESSSDSGGSSSTGECAPGPSEMFGECFNSCDCGTGLTCRPNYVGGYLAECSAECTDDAECGAGVCSAGWCILPCGAMGECAESTWCYPGMSADGSPVIDVRHPVRHCMPHVSEG
jgi:hypothetical protein